MSMDGSSLFADSHMNNNRVSHSSEVLDPVLVSNSSSPSFLCPSSMVNVEEFRGENSAEKPIFAKIDCKLDSGIEDNDGCFRQPEKKRRLLPDQVQFLEKCFDLENKLEPERKLQLAKDLGLHSRQVSIWFQNRRARYKTKLLEKDYDSLKASYDQLKANYNSLYEENERLKNEVYSLKDKFPKLEQFDPSNPLDLQPKNPLFAPNAAPALGGKQEDAASTARSDVFDSDSPRYTDGNHSVFLEPTDSSHVFEPDPSDYSPYEEDNLSKSLLPLPKLEIESFDDLQSNSYYLGFPIQDHGTWFWQL